ncbi:outer membrane protein assembly factor BamB family protein [Longirhabdus pacifica]|uniref:outer membrane protein assembly factor BamB family protein n=1 Tax=Longirhabdus pacifica TaxID=2305227 RepID=UPI001008A98A|nr:PQQ-binding-like beta-propeller repeat protein [Longirhabdus pacifica]
MPEQTPKLSIKTPLGNEYILRQNFNENWDIIDQNAASQSELDDHQADSIMHITAAERADWNGKETPTGAQAKADQALQSAKDYADVLVAGIDYGADKIIINDANDVFTSTNVEGALQELFTSVSNGKHSIAAAIIDKDPVKDSKGSDDLNKLANDIRDIEIPFAVHTLEDMEKLTYYKPELLSAVINVSETSAQITVDVYGNLYYTGSVNNNGAVVIKFSSDLQRVIWSKSLTYRTTAITVDEVDDAVYVGDSNGHVYKYNKTTGNLLWQWTYSDVQARTVLKLSAYNDSVYVLRSKTFLKITAGQLDWSVDTNFNYYDVKVDPSGNYYYVTIGKTLYSIEAQYPPGGTYKWKFEVAYRCTNIFIDVNHDIYISTSPLATLKSSIYKLSYMDGMLLWQYEHEEEAENILYFEVDRDGFLYMAYGDSKQCRILSPSGKFFYEFDNDLAQNALSDTFTIYEGYMFTFNAKRLYKMFGMYRFPIV